MFRILIILLIFYPPLIFANYDESDLRELFNFHGWVYTPARHVMIRYPGVPALHVGEHFYIAVAHDRDVYVIPRMELFLDWEVDRGMRAGGELTALAHLIGDRRYYIFPNILEYRRALEHTGYRRGTRVNGIHYQVPVPAPAWNPQFRIHGVGLWLEDTQCRPVTGFTALVRPAGFNQCVDILNRQQHVPALEELALHLNLDELPLMAARGGVAEIVAGHALDRKEYNPQLYRPGIPLKIGLHHPLAFSPFESNYFDPGSRSLESYLELNNMLDSFLGPHWRARFGDGKDGGGAGESGGCGSSPISAC